ncbi:hypothetical protein, partial [Mycolicibacterium fortuitum]|uniref:hypothetical protein n=1 Tax=Mycolicibacterium fortuitum TaxID=1766 RepID=UPI0010543C76
LPGPLVLATYEIVCSKGYDADTAAAVFLRPRAVLGGTEKIPGTQVGALGGRGAARPGGRRRRGVLSGPGPRCHRGQPGPLG